MINTLLLAVMVLLLADGQGTAYAAAAVPAVTKPEAGGVKIEDRTWQKGLYVDITCRNNSANHTTYDADYDDCQCIADIHYPQISGLKDMAAQNAINESFKNMAVQAQCKGETNTDQSTSKQQDSVSQHYETTLQTPGVIAFKFTDWAYTGGAHGNGSIDGVIIDVDKAKVLSLSDIFAATELAAVNKQIYDALSARSEDQVFHDQIEQRKDKFIANGECQGCTLTLDGEGIKVVFQTYEVASFADGNIEVPIDSKYLSNPTIVQALVKPKSIPLAEKK